MSTAVGSGTATAAVGAGKHREQVADVFVIFGITGDLAKVMTFHSLYRLERRGLLSCPIVGVAVSDWSKDDLGGHARAAIEGTGEQIDESVGRCGRGGRAHRPAGCWLLATSYLISVVQDGGTLARRDAMGSPRGGHHPIRVKSMRPGRPPHLLPSCERLIRTG